MFPRVVITRVIVISLRTVFAFLLRDNVICHIGIYTLSDLGDLSNLIGSLSRNIQQYSPLSEWIMWKVVFFPIFLGKIF